MAQLVVHFMASPVAGLAEMGRGRGPLAAFRQAVRELDPRAPDESGLAGVREGHLA